MTADSYDYDYDVDCNSNNNNNISRKMHLVYPQNNIAWNIIRFP
jgi:hypothetical protein